MATSDHVEVFYVDRNTGWGAALYNIKGHQIGTITNPFNSGSMGWRVTFNGGKIDLFTNSLKETKERAIAHIAHLMTSH